MPTNATFAQDVLRAAVKKGIRSFCICGGTATSPLAAALAAADGLETLNFFDESSAAYFALGRTLATGQPVAIIVGSDAASATLPAMVEARRAGLPLVLVVSRLAGQNEAPAFPPEAREAGTEWIREVGQELGSWRGIGPFRLDLAFSDPPLDATFEATVYDGPSWAPPRHDVSGAKELRDFLAGQSRPLVLVGALERRDRAAVADFLAALGAPVYAEAVSGLRGIPELDPLLVRSGERLLQLQTFSGVLRLGRAPGLRFWRDLETRFATTPVLSVDRLPFAGLASGRSTHVHTELGALLALVKPTPVEDRAEFRTLDRETFEAKRVLFLKHPGSEVALLHALSRRVPANSRLFLGNGLPFRQWELAADVRAPCENVFANVGSADRQGAVSSFFGVTRPSSENWAILGDLTALRDLSAPWALPQLGDPVCRIVIMNNGGGRGGKRVQNLMKNFDPAHRERLIENAHGMNFEGWAALWNLGYEKWDRVSPHPPGARQSVIELTPDPDHDAAFWKDYEALWESYS